MARERPWLGCKSNIDQALQLASFKLGQPPTAATTSPRLARCGSSGKCTYCVDKVLSRNSLPSPHHDSNNYNTERLSLLKGSCHHTPLNTAAMPQSDTAKVRVVQQQMCHTSGAHSKACSATESHQQQGPCGCCSTKDDLLHTRWRVTTWGHMHHMNSKDYNMAHMHQAVLAHIHLCYAHAPQHITNML